MARHIVDSLQTISNKVNKKFFSDHRWIADVLYFEGPLLSLFKGSKEQDYFYYWCDNDAINNRWLAIPVTREQIEAYFAKTVSLHQLISSFPKITAVDTNNDGEVTFAHSFDVAALPAAYMPAQTSYFDVDLCPSNIYKSIEAGVYAIYIDKKWFFDDFSLVERVFTQLYAFIYSLKNVGGLVAEERIQLAFASYPWRGGFSAVHFYDSLRTAIPSIHEPKVESFKFSSPGAIKLELLKEVASATGDLINHFGDHTASINDAYEDARKYLRNAGLLQVQNSDVDINALLTESTKADIADYFNLLANELNMTEFANEIESLTGNPLISLKILLSFCRRIDKINKFQLNGKLSFDEPFDGYVD